MASGAEHFAMAEELIGYANEDDRLNPEDQMSPQNRASLIALAQVHATLANAAATALSAYGTTRAADYQAWVKVCGEPGKEG